MELSKDPLAFVLGAFIVIVLSWVLLGRAEKIKRHGRRLRKAPDTLPLVGNGIVFLQARQKLFSWFVKCERQTGYETLEISVPTLPPGVIINDPRNLDFVFKNEGLFSKGTFVKQRSWDLFGHGIINVDGHLWKAQRKAGLAFLNTPTLRVLADVALPQYLLQSIEYLERQASGPAVDLQGVFHEITTQLMGKMAYNMEVHADDDFASAFDYASGATAERFQNPLWFLTEIFLGGKFRRSVKLVKSFGRQIVSRAVADRKAAEEERKASKAAKADLERVSGSLVQSLLEAIGDEQIVADAALNYLSAGRDTTAQALTWTFYLLMENSAVVDKIRAEVRHVLAKNSPSPPTAAPNRPHQPLDTTLFTPHSLPYTHAVFYESIRLYPPVPFEIKQCTRPATLPDGTCLPAGSVVVWCPWAMNRSRETWGPDADAFRPARWLVEQDEDGDAGGEGEGDDAGSDNGGSTGRKRLTIVNRSAAEFPVFNGGPRLCLGKKMAELVAVQVIAAMAWVFEFRPAWEARPGERVSKSSLTLPMEGGLPVYVRCQ